MSVGEDAGWPDAATARWTDRPEPEAAWIVDEPRQGACALLRAFAGSTLHSIAPVEPDSDLPLRQLQLLPGPEGPGLGLHVPINPMARAHRHTGLGFTGYILVLTDRPSRPPTTPPTPTVAWLTARFPEQYVVVVEGERGSRLEGSGIARGRAGRFTTDLWRLLAHASMTVDLDPGDIIARECIESLRLGTPIVVPAGTVGAVRGLPAASPSPTCPSCSRALSGSSATQDESPFPAKGLATPTLHSGIHALHCRNCSCPSAGAFVSAIRARRSPRLVADTGQHASTAMPRTTRWGPAGGTDKPEIVGAADSETVATVSRSAPRFICSPGLLSLG